MAATPLPLYQRYHNTVLGGRRDPSSRTATNRTPLRRSRGNTTAARLTASVGGDALRTTRSRESRTPLRNTRTLPSPLQCLPEHKKTSMLGDSDLDFTPRQVEERDDARGDGLVRRLVHCQVLGVWHGEVIDGAAVRRRVRARAPCPTRDEAKSRWHKWENARAGRRRGGSGGWRRRLSPGGS